ncbi:uncharacterized protein [Macrobrachium rosenbergii]|uniref:uncharacterized protein isoform X2 n=1 Tax=Macrobrachium rosenbergii TaxID=79674 RepID=UPI0034D6474A
MVSTCCVPDCKNKRIKQSSQHVRFYRIPKYNLERRAKWIQAIGRGEDWRPTAFSRVCSDHFILGEKSDNKLSPNYVPCIFSHTTITEKRKLLKLFDIHNREVVEKVSKIDVATTLLTLVEEALVDDETEELSSYATQRKRNSDEVLAEDDCFYENTMGTNRQGFKDQDTQTLLLDSYLKSLEDEYYKLKSELFLVKEKDMFRDMELDMFKDNDRKVRYLTGLSSYDMLKVLSEYISAFQRQQGKLSKFQQLMITLIKIKLNLPMPFLGILFNISLTTISRVFRFTIDLLFTKIVPLLVFWPPRDDLRLLIPPNFEDCENCLYSVDFFELDVEVRGCTSHSVKEKLDNLDAYFSNSLIDIRKRKFMMSVAPQGTIIFISKGTSGDISEKVLAAESGFFNHIAAEDIVVTDRGLDIENEVDMRGALLELAKDISSDTADLVSVRNVVSSMKRSFQIIESTILRNWVRDNDKDGLCTWDKILQVVCALYNLTNEVWNYREYLSGLKEQE